MSEEELELEAALETVRVKRLEEIIEKVSSGRTRTLDLSHFRFTTIPALPILAGEPTGHIHILWVPPEMTSAEAAITWVNHGIHPDEFAVQT